MVPGTSAAEFKGWVAGARWLGGREGGVESQSGVRIFARRFPLHGAFGGESAGIVGIWGVACYSFRGRDIFRNASIAQASGGRRSGAVAGTHTLAATCGEGSSSALQLIRIGALMATLEQVNIVTADGFGLQLPSGLASQLALRITEAANALPKRGLEVCGLLLGEHTGNTFVVTSLVPLNCRYSEGPAFRALESELRDELGMVQPLSDVIGFYRSRNDGSLDLDRQDELLLDLLPHRPVPVLVIRQQKNTAGEGRLHVVGDSNGQGGVASVGEIFPTRPWMVAPRPGPDPLRVPPDTDNRVVFRSVPVRESEVLSLAENHAVEAAAAPREWDGARTKWVALTTAAVVLLLLIGWRVKEFSTVPKAEQLSAASGEQFSPVVVVPSRKRLARGETSGPAARTVEPDGGTNQEAKALQSLKMWIRNDENSTLREIAVRDLARRGRADPEALPLLAETARRDRSERVRAAALESIARGWQLNPATRSILENLVRTEKSPAVRQIAERELATAIKLSLVNSGSAGSGNDSRSVPPGGNARSTTPPNGVPAPAPSSAVLKPTQTARPFRLTGPAAPASRPAELPLPPAVEVTRNKPSVPILPAPLAALPSRPASPIRPPAPIQYTPPELLVRKPDVLVPPDFRQLVRSETVIAMRLAVDARGRVSKIYPSEVKGGIGGRLWTFYSDAVRHWVFKPAGRNGEPIPGETTLNFRISPAVRR